MKRLRWATCLTMVLALAACSGGGGTGDAGGGGGGGGGGGTANTASVDGYALGAHRQAPAEQTLLTTVLVEAYALPFSGSRLAFASTNSSGRFVFSAAAGNGLPPDRTLLLRATGGTRVVSAIVNTIAGASSRNLNETTHIAALALQDSTGAVSDASIARYERAARDQLNTALGSGALDYTQLANQTAANALATAAEAAVTAGTVPNNQAPSLSQLQLTPSQLGKAGGAVEISLRASDPEADTLTAVALVFTPGVSAPQVVNLVGAGGIFTGGFTAAANNTSETRLLTVVIVVDDGQQATTPTAVRTVTVLPDGRVLLDILCETLVDEPASRAAAVEAWRTAATPRWRRGGTRARQVNANQSIRGATVSVIDDPTITGTSGSDGLLLLEAPLALADDGAIGLLTSIAGRVTYRQFLLLPQSVTLAAGDRIEVDLVLATQAQWTSVASDIGLGSLNWALGPLTSFFNVSGAPGLSATAATTVLRSISSTGRTDDYDWFGSNLPAGAVTASGTFTHPVQANTSFGYGPANLALAAGQVAAASALLPPS
ncbi:MAG: hypothetical protein IT204_09135 [Fimbriimonadaceae bacterium]|nr:hypothetical protein [Fimbriimonadaceae bacterium]